MSKLQSEVQRSQMPIMEITPWTANPAEVETNLYHFGHLSQMLAKQPSVSRFETASCGYSSPDFRIGRARRAEWGERNVVRNRTTVEPSRNL